MDYLPKDPAILVSSVNMLLRDEEFDTLESLCYNFGTEPKKIKDYLFGHGFVYSEKQKQFRPIGYDSVTFSRHVIVQSFQLSQSQFLYRMLDDTYQLFASIII